MDQRDEDLEDVMREERSRGRRPVDTVEQRKRRKALAELGTILREGTGQDLEDYLNALGFGRGSAQYELAFRSSRAERRP